MGIFDEKSKKRDRRLSRELADKNIAMQRETNALNKQMNDENNEFNRSLWYEQQEYNSPENQKKRLLAAGMNCSTTLPNLPAMSGIALAIAIASLVLFKDAAEIELI